MNRLILLLFSLSAGLLFAEENIGQIAISFSGSGLTMDLYDNNNTSYSKSFMPNIPVSGSIDLFYRGFGGRFSKGLSLGNNVGDISTDVTDIQVFSYFSDIGLDLYYQNYTGYYHKDEYISKIDIYRNMNVSTFGLNLYYKMKGNNDLSILKNVSKNNQNNLSWVLYLVTSLSKRKMSSDISVISIFEAVNFPIFSNLTYLDFTIPSLSIGILVPYHNNHFSTCCGLSLGLGYPISDCSLNPILNLKGNLKINVQYDFNEIVLGYNMIGDFDAITFSNSQVLQFNSVKLDFYIGYNFRES